MRARLLVTLAAAIAAAGLGGARPSVAAMLLDPSETVGAGRVRLDGAADVTFSRDIRLKAADRTVDTSERTFGIGGSFGLIEGLDGFLAVGATRLSLDPNDALPSGPFQGQVGFAFGGGLRYRFLDERYFKVGASAAVTRHESTQRDVTATWITGDFLLGASVHSFRDIVPFAGMAVGITDGQFEGPFGRVEFRQEDVVGAVVGLRYAATSQVQATLAGRYFDRKEVAFALSFGF